MSEGPDSAQDEKKRKFRWTPRSCLTGLAILVGFAIVMTLVTGSCGDSQPAPSTAQPEPRHGERAPISNDYAEELAGTVWSCGAFSTDNENLIVVNILAMSDLDALETAEELAYEVEEGLIPARDRPAAIRVLQLILSCRGWDE